MPPESNVRFLLAVKLQDPTADILIIPFQHNFPGQVLWLQIPRQLLQNGRSAKFMVYVAD